MKFLRHTCLVNTAAALAIGMAVAVAGFTMPNMAVAGEAANPCEAQPCAAQPCAAQPCAAQPCAAQPCALNPCAVNPCAANPCGATNPCAPKY